VSAFALQAQPCSTTIAKAVAGQARTVYLIGDDAPAALQVYLDAATRQGVRVSLWKLRVTLSEGSGQRQVSMGIFDMVNGQGLRARWRQKLKGLAGQLDPKLLAEARRQGWDVACDPARTGTAGAQVVGSLPAQMPYEAMLAFKAGLQYAARGDYRNALKEFSAVEALAPSYPQLHVNMGATYLQLNDLVRAEQHLGRAISETPELGLAHYNMACLLARLGRSDAALKSLSVALDKGLNGALALLRTDPDLASLRKHRAFSALAHRAAGSS
jgi:tetratricopeptide (TPR) repeat protein